MASLLSLMFVGLILLATMSDPGSCQSYEESRTLMSEMLTNYDRRQRPVKDQSTPTYVGVSFYIISIQDFSEVDSKFSVVGLFSMLWKDDIITWDPADYDGIESAMFDLSDVWYPKLVLTNPYSKLEDMGANWMSVRLFSSGYASFVPGAVFESICSVDVTYYPFDTQNCVMSFSSWGYLGKEVILYPISDKVLMPFYSKNGEWDLVSTSVVRIPGSPTTYDTIVFNFQLQRKPLFLIINVILPILFMAVINLLVFILPAESGERVGYSITVLLALAVFMTLVADNLPKSSQPMSILSYYLMSILVLSTLMTVITILNLRLHFKEGDVPAWCACWTRSLLCFRCRFGSRTRAGSAKSTKVYPLDEDGQTKRQEVEKSPKVSDLPKVTWVDASKCVDLMALVVFLLATIIVNAVFVTMLQKNKT